MSYISLFLKTRNFLLRSFQFGTTQKSVHCSRRYGFLQTQSVVLVHTVYIPIANLNFANLLYIAVPG